MGKLAMELPPSVHTKGELEQMQSLPLDVKIRMTQFRIKEWLNVYDGYISFSGGKDSTVLLHIAREIFPDIPAVFCDTGLEYPEIRQFVKKTENVTWIRPEMSFRKTVEHYGYPVSTKETAHRIRELRHQNLSETYKAKLLGDGRYAIPKCWRKLIDAPFDTSNKCCDVMKKRPFHKYRKETGRCAIIGSMACESQLRRSSWERYGCNMYDAREPMSRPMSFWTEQDVFQYLQTRSVPYCQIYGEIIKNDDGQYVNTGVERTGCMFCMFGVGHEPEPNRFQRMKETHPKQYAYCMRPWNKGGLGLDDVLNYVDIKH